MTHASISEAVALLENPATPAEDLAAIATAHPSLRHAVAAHPNAYPELQEWIALVSQSATRVDPHAEPNVKPDPVHPAEPEPEPEPEDDGRTASPIAVDAGVESVEPLGEPVRGTNMIPWIITAAAIFVALVAVGILVARPGVSSVEERGSATPEEAATRFVESLIAGDFETAASAFATESLVTDYSFTAHLERQSVFTPTTGYLPTEGYRVLNLEKRRGEVAMAIGQVARTALMPEVDHKQTYAFTDGADASLSPTDFEEGLDTARLEALSVVRVDAIEPTSGTQFADNAARAIAPFGGQDTRTVAVLFDAPDGTAALGMEVIQYDDSWFVWHLYGAVLGTPSNSLAPMSVDEYVAMVEGAQRAVDES